jgi:hypothetical protein
MENFLFNLVILHILNHTRVKQEEKKYFKSTNCVCIKDVSCNYNIKIQCCT